MATLHPIAEHPGWHFCAPDLALWHAPSSTAIISDPQIFHDRTHVHSRDAAQVADSANETSTRLRALQSRLHPERLVVCGELAAERALPAGLLRLAEIVSEFEWQWIAVPDGEAPTLRDVASQIPELLIRDEIVIDGWTVVSGTTDGPLPAIVGGEHPVANSSDGRNVSAVAPTLLVWHDLMVVPAFSRSTPGADAGGIAFGRGRSPLPGAEQEGMPAAYVVIDGQCHRYGSVTELPG